MKPSKFTLRSLAMLGASLLLSTLIFAQSNRGRNYKNRGYYTPRTHVSIGFGYNPYYNYRPVARPRIYYRPAYRLPYRYSHYGPAFGIHISVLPFGYSRFFIGNDPFYYYDGIYYRPYKTGGYVVAQPPLGAIVKHLPSGAKTTVIDGQKYYELGGTFYQERVTANNKLRYEVVGTDGVLNTTNADADDEDDTPVQAPPAAAPVQPNNNNSNSSTGPVNGVVVSQLPEGCTAVNINQQKYYVSPEGVYYQQIIEGNTTSYKVAGSTGNTL